MSIYSTVFAYTIAVFGLAPTFTLGALLKAAFVANLAGFAAGFPAFSGLAAFVVAFAAAIFSARTFLALARLSASPLSNAACRRDSL